jgi:DNA-binding winged helix-turn-helix (wHTH) protein
MAPVRFGSHAFDPVTGILRRGNAACDLQNQPSQLLGLLLERAGEVVTREQIRLALWPETVVSYDQNINFAVRQIRVALGVDANLVQTVPRRGYRFIGNVMLADQEVGRSLWRASRGSSKGRRTGGRGWWNGPAAAAIALALASGFGAGILVRDAPAGRFVYDHLVHPDRCPYLRIFLPNHRNS